MPINSASIQQTPIFNFDSTNVNSPEFQDYMTQLTQQLNNVQVLLNMKDTGYYDTNEFISGQVYYPIPDPAGVKPLEWRTVVRKVIDFSGTAGSLPAFGCSAVPHGIPVTAGYFFTRIYGAAANPTAVTFIELPYASSNSVNDNIEVSVDATNVTICTGADYSGYTNVQIVLEYIPGA